VTVARESQNTRGRPKHVSQCHITHNKSHIDCPL